jgi:hypothetical protein
MQKHHRGLQPQEHGPWVTACCIRSQLTSCSPALANHLAWLIQRQLFLVNMLTKSQFLQQNNRNTVKMKSAVFAFTLVAAAAAQDIAALAQCGVSVSRRNQMMVLVAKFYIYSKPVPAT